MSNDFDQQYVGRAAAVIVAAGRGERFGPRDKVLATVGGRPMLAWTLDAAESAKSVGEVIVVTGEHTDSAIRQLIENGPWHLHAKIIVGGPRRHDSVMAGVRAVSDEMEIVLIHDAARPLVTGALFDVCAQAAGEDGAAIVAIPVSDTIKRVVDGRVSETIPRNDLWAAQTPQGFRRSLLLEASGRFDSRDVELTDEASLFERLGHEVTVVTGASSNLKITRADDLHVAEGLLRRRTNAVHESQADDR